MSEINRRRTGELLKALFSILIDEPDGLQPRVALSRLVERIKLTPYEAGTFDSGGKRFDKIVRWATVDCVKAGWFLKQDGKWQVTEEGRKANKQYSDPEAFYREAARLYREWDKSRPSSSTDADEGEPELAKTAAVTFEEATESAWAEIEQYLATMKPYDFQELVGALLRGLGFHVSWTSPPGKDGGIDVLASPDPLGFGAPRVKVQVKRQATAVNVEGLRSFMALLDEGDVGLFVSLGGFTKDAQDEARRQPTRKVTLVDLHKFFELWVDRYPKLNDADRRRLPLQPIHFLAPES